MCWTLLRVSASVWNPKTAQASAETTGPTNAPGSWPVIRRKPMSAATIAIAATSTGSTRGGRLCRRGEHAHAEVHVHARGERHARDRGDGAERRGGEDRDPEAEEGQDRQHRAEARRRADPLRVPQ